MIVIAAQARKNRPKAVSLFALLAAHPDQTAQNLAGPAG
jgi:hypothetical protein